MTRSESREQAFILVFERSFHETPFPELLENARLAREYTGGDFAEELAEGTLSHLPELDTAISSHLTPGWKIGRLGRVARSILRVAVFEMFFREDIPDSVSINEAVELAKKYGGDDDSAFVNGVLGGIARAQSTVEG
ncbi:MAG: transcription antitermination factor NusB [Oscillospiraceae bacterium]|jgi:N utilization substance protein B|nr:transcription antitermination factor NusB [Oscillospiraceae bacterium]